MPTTSSRYVNSQILTIPPQVALASFGPALLINDVVSSGAANFVEYSSYEAVLVDYSASDPAAISAASYFGNLTLTPDKIFILTYDAQISQQITDAKALAISKTKEFYPIFFNLLTSSAVILDWVTFANENKKIALIDIFDEAQVQVGGVFETINNERRVTFWYDSSNSQPLSAAESSIFATSELNVQSVNVSYALRNFSVLQPDDTIDNTQADLLDNLNVNYYTKVDNTAITYAGRMANGTPMNEIQYEDYAQNVVDTNLFNFLQNRANLGFAVTFDDAGFEDIRNNISDSCRSFNFLVPSTLDGTFVSSGFKIVMPDPDDFTLAQKTAGEVTGILVYLSTIKFVLKLELSQIIN